MFNIVFNYLGSNGPFILFFLSNFLLWNKHNLYFFYCIGIFVNTILNLIIKGILQQPRPSEDPTLFHLAINRGKRFIFKDYFPHDIFGMPSGHVQASFFSVVFIYFSLKNITVLYIYVFIAILTMSQRIVYNHHTILQVAVGAIFGSLFGYFFYYLAQQKLKGIMDIKPDDYAPS
jgi:membrane-associated phospholipid phosphatase